MVVMWCSLRLVYEEVDVHIDGLVRHEQVAWHFAGIFDRMV